MKRKLLIAAICIISANLYSQTYKLENVINDYVSNTYLSHWKILESTNDNLVDTFSLWGYQKYFDSRDDGSYEVEYFKGSSKEVYQILSHIVEFSEKYKHEDNVFTNTLNVKVKISSYFGFKYTLVYDKEGKVVCKFTLSRWKEMLSKFVYYCENQKITYK